ncbi:hypothetical protein C8Q76DRAFT_782573 [Earliella scabrosa]|nr:hypothetical protein C8Q76DRAFT_782573 [Earliella scabrosa]
MPVKGRGNRDQIVLATQYTFGYSDTDQEVRLVPLALWASDPVQGSLKKFKQTDYIDLHWGHSTSIPEIMQALDALVKQNLNAQTSTLGRMEWLGSESSGMGIAPWGGVGQTETIRFGRPQTEKVSAALEKVAREVGGGVTLVAVACQHYHTRLQIVLTPEQIKAPEDSPLHSRPPVTRINFSALVRRREANVGGVANCDRQVGQNTHTGRARQRQ